MNPWARMLGTRAESLISKESGTHIGTAQLVFGAAHAVPLLNGLCHQLEGTTSDPRLLIVVRQHH